MKLTWSRICRLAGNPLIVAASTEQAIRLWWRNATDKQRMEAINAARRLKP